jgi:hypothetical protein
MPFQQSASATAFNDIAWVEDQIKRFEQSECFDEYNK